MTMNRIQAQLAKSGVRIRVNYRGNERESMHYLPCITIGRARGDGSPDVDLSPDVNVSRNHARLWIENSTCWIEDLGSKFGTRVDGAPIAGKGRVRVDNAKAIQVGDTMLNVEPLGTGVGGFAELPVQPPAPSTIEIAKTLQSSPGPWVASRPVTLDDSQRQAMLLEILVQFSLPAPLDQLMQTITARVVELIPGAKRGTLLLRSPDSDRLVLAAFVSPSGPAVSETLARRALEQREAFVWRNTFGLDPAVSIQRHQIQSGMYAPLVYDDVGLGVLCVDNPNTHAAFSAEDLQLLVAVADHAAVAVHHQQIQEELTSRVKVLEGLLWNFSSDTRARLINKARTGRLSPGLSKSKLPVLAVRLRDLTANLFRLTNEQGLQLLALYTEAVANCVFQFGGTLCADTGETIVAVFGTPETLSDPQADADRAAEAIRAALTQLNAQRSGVGELVCSFRIAVNSAELVHGFVGSGERLQFKVIGDGIRELREQTESSTVTLNPESRQKAA